MDTLCIALHVAWCALYVATGYSRFVVVEDEKVW